MTDISHHISCLINDVFESSSPLNGTVIGMLNLLFNQGAEFITVQKLCCCRWKCMIGLRKSHSDVICSRQQPIWLSIKSFVLPSWFFIDWPATVHHWLLLLLSAEPRESRLVDSILCFHSMQARHTALTVCEQKSHLFYLKVRLPTFCMCQFIITSIHFTKDKQVPGQTSTLSKPDRNIEQNQTHCRWPSATVWDGARG